MDHLDPISLIATERKRQVQLGYSRAHDDAEDNGQLAQAAEAYAVRPLRRSA